MQQKHPTWPRAGGRFSDDWETNHLLPRIMTRVGRENGKAEPETRAERRRAEQSVQYGAQWQGTEST
jgi:hypothetical protein